MSDLNNVNNNYYSSLINNWSNTSSNSNMISSISSLISEDGNTGSSDLLTGMMLGLMCSGTTGTGANSLYGSNENGSTSNSSFNVMLSSLLNAVNTRNQQVKQGLIQNGQTSLDETISDVVFRPSESTTNTDISTLPEGERINEAIKKASANYGVSESLIRAIIQVESNYNPKAVSSAGAMGLMQLMPSNVKEYNVKDPFNIEENIDAGTRHIRDYLRTYSNDLNMALAAYNFGPGNMASRGITSSKDFYKLPTETKNYLVKVNSLL